MRTKCHSCLCRTCLNVCRCEDCKGKIESCENYKGFRQLSIFEQEEKRHMRVLAACEESQRVCVEFRRLGHEAYSCDIEPCSGGHPEWHIQADVLPLLNGDCNFRTVDGAEHRIYGKWDMIIAFPPCTHLAVSRARYFEEKQKDGRQKQGIDFFIQFVNADCEKIAIENPVGIMSTKYRKPDQIIQPYEFGHTERKSTCLWLKGLPPLIPTNIVEPELRICGNGVVDSKWHYDTYNLPPKIRAKERSKTFPGVAKAMAEQWGKVDEPPRQYQPVPRNPLSYYGLTDERVDELRKLVQSGKYDSIAASAAHMADETIAEYILLSITKSLSFEGLDKLYGRGEIGRMPCSRTGFYYTKKYFWSLFDEELRRIGICRKN